MSMYELLCNRHEISKLADNLATLKIKAKIYYYYGIHNPGYMNRITEPTLFRNGIKMCHGNPDFTLLKKLLAAYGDYEEKPRKKGNGKFELVEEK